MTAYVLDFLKWAGFVVLLGIIAFPISFRFLPKLRDKGYSVAKALGLLLWGFIYWLLVSLHLAPNEIGGALFALLIILGASIWFGTRLGWKEIWSWVKTHWRTLLVVDVLFLLAFAIWTLLRSTNPDILYTEKPMELAFVNSIMRSPTFPPNDPWLSGYAISYYYFGYLFIAMLCRVTAVVSEVGYNLSVGLWFSLTALGAYGLLYNLLGKKSADMESREESTRGRFSALFGPLFVLLVSNLEAFLEMLHSKGIFWTQTASGEWTSKFWAWLNIPELVNPPNLPLTWLPRGLNGWWWWRASRLWQDFDILKARGPLEVIHEFPAFTYFLADLHPHVLAMPFVLLILAVGLNLYRTFSEWKIKEFRILGWLKTPEFWLLAIIVGSLGFLNTWNFPIYVALISAVFALTCYEQLGWQWRRLWDLLRFAIVLGVAGALIYLPFYLSFSSQAGGFLPSMEFFTEGKYYWIHFLPLLFPIFVWLIWQMKVHWAEIKFWSGFLFSSAIVFGLWVISYLLGGLLGSTVSIGSALQQSNSTFWSGLGAKLLILGNAYLGVHGGASPGLIFWGSLRERILSPFIWITIFLILWFVWSLFHVLIAEKLPASQRKFVGSSLSSDDFHNSKGFVLLLILLGGGLTLFPEFFFLRDGFADRMNTIFKFYFETWVVWGLAAAFTTISLLKSLRKAWLATFSALIVIILSLSLLYPIFFAATETNKFKPTVMTLDGLHYLEEGSPDDYAAIQFLKKVPSGTMVEAVGGSYSYSNGVDYERISTHTGLPTVLGWTGHELQWRGGVEEMGSRESDVKMLYETSSWLQAESILKQYQIRYVYVGDVERFTYRVVMDKFSANLPVIFSNTTVTIYEVPASILGTP
jgi:YYY domain-containing protein